MLFLDFIIGKFFIALFVLLVLLLVGGYGQRLVNEEYKGEELDGDLFDEDL